MRDQRTRRAAYSTSGLDYVDGTISVDWSKVARLESSQLFIVKEENGRYIPARSQQSMDLAGRPPHDSGE